jgi:hypothetical protein
MIIPGYVNSYTTVNADWLEINGFAALPLQPNTTYAWTFSFTLSGDAGWMEIATDNTGANLFGSTSGSAASVTFGGGTGAVNLPSSGSYDAVFDAVLQPTLSYTQNANGTITFTWPVGRLVKGALPGGNGEPYTVVATSSPKTVTPSATVAYWVVYP